MHFEAHALLTKQFVDHKSKKMNHNNPCSYYVSHNSNSAGQAGIGWCTSSLFVNLANMNRAEIRRPYSALFWQDRERIGAELITSGKSVKYVRARNRSYF
jgi:hypothetical protein